MRCRLSVKARGERTRILSSVSLHLVLSLLLNQEPGRGASERATALLLFRRTCFRFSRSYQTLNSKPQTRYSPSTNHYSLITVLPALKSTHPVGRSMPPPLSRGDLDQKRISVVSGLFSEDGERLTANVFSRSSDLSPQVFTKDGSTVWDDGRWTALPLFMLFSLFQALFTRGAELASRSDTGLRKQTGEGEAFTGGGMFFPPKNGVPILTYSEKLSELSGI